MKRTLKAIIACLLTSIILLINASASTVSVSFTPHVYVNGNLYATYGWMSANAASNTASAVVAAADPVVRSMLPTLSGKSLSGSSYATLFTNDQWYCYMYYVDAAPPPVTTYQVSYHYTGTIPLSAPSLPGISTYSSGTGVSVSVPILTGYQFSGWSPYSSSFSMPSNAVYQVGSWTPLTNIQYKVEFYKEN